VQVFQEAISFTSLKKGRSTSLVSDFFIRAKPLTRQQELPKFFLRASLKILHVK
jgi:hypothetical protein